MITPIWKGSPNFDTLRKPIDRIVIHWFGMGTLEGASANFQKPNGTSAHFGISDDRVWQWVKEENVAYHAGNYAMNQRSIGIEHDANPDKPLSEKSYETSASIIADLCKRYTIPLDRTHIIKHSEVKATQCPGTIDLDKLIALAKGMSMVTDIQTYLGVTDDTAAKERLKEHLGEVNGKCNWGAEGDQGGYLGSERKLTKTLLTNQSGIAVLLGLPANATSDQIMAEIKRLKDQTIPVPTPPSTPGDEVPEELIINGRRWSLNGINRIDGKLQANYKRAD